MFKKKIFNGNEHSTEYWEKWHGSELIHFRITIFHDSGWVEIAPRSKKAVKKFKELKDETKTMKKYGFQYQTRQYAEGERLAIRHKMLSEEDVKKIVEILLS